MAINLGRDRGCGWRSSVHRRLFSLHHETLANPIHGVDVDSQDSGDLGAGEPALGAMAITEYNAAEKGFRIDETARP